MLIQDRVKVRSSEMRRLLEACQRGIRCGRRPVAVEQVSEDVRGDVLAFGGDVRVDVEIQIAVASQRAGTIDCAVEQVGEP